MNKTITINPDLFKLSTNIKPKTKSTKSVTNQPVNHGILRNKFLKRIRQHKSTEIKHDTRLQALHQHQDHQKDLPKDLPITDLPITDYDDEYVKSVEYINQLARLQQKNLKRTHLDKKTVKNYKSHYEPVQQNVQIDLPHELQQIQPPQHSFLETDVPYGILKGGSKPTYRTWSMTRKNNTPHIHTPPPRQHIHTSSRGTPNIHTSSRGTPNIHTSSRGAPNIPHINTQRINALSTPRTPTPTIDNDKWLSTSLISKPQDTTTNANAANANATNKISKKISTKRYTLGKSKIKRQVSVLIKNRHTRKKILTAHKELKQQSISSIKDYLNRHNLLKVGSTAPNDVIRKLYETSKLSGDIYNMNTDTLIHNLHTKQST